MEFQALQAMTGAPTPSGFDYVSQGTDAAEAAHWLEAQGKDPGLLNEYADDFAISGITPAIGE